jgi:hypothetical protein
MLYQVHLLYRTVLNFSYDVTLVKLWCRIFEKILLSVCELAGRVTQHGGDTSTCILFPRILVLWFPTDRYINVCECSSPPDLYVLSGRLPVYEVFQIHLEHGPKLTEA